MLEGFLLDTNVSSETITRQPDASVTFWLAGQESERLYLSVISVGELRRGVEGLVPGRRRSELEVWLSDTCYYFANRILPVTLPVAEVWGLQEARRRAQGLPLESADGLIAATALVHGLTLVTRNTRDFVGLGLTIVNPWEA